MIYLLLLVCCLGGLVASDPLIYDLDDAESLFAEFMATHNRQYANDEEKNMRFEIFQKKIEEVNDLNRKYNSSAHGINMFSDMTQEEFLRDYTGLSTEDKLCACKRANISADEQTPENFDWRAFDVVSRVRNQMNCRSSWAFAAIGNVESQYAIKHRGQMIELSESQLLDCDWSSSGCYGGSYYHAIKYLQTAGGAMSRLDYPYVPLQQSCKFSRKKVKVAVTGCNVFIPVGEEALKDIVLSTGPLAISICADSLSTYRGGILDVCSRGPLNHAVLLVGYGVENDIPYWIFKSSFSAGFGEGGFVRVRRNQNSCNMMKGLIVSAVVA